VPESPHFKKCFIVLFCFTFFNVESKLMRSADLSKSLFPQTLFINLLRRTKKLFNFNNQFSRNKLRDSFVSTRGINYFSEQRRMFWIAYVGHKYRAKMNLYKGKHLFNLAQPPETLP